MQHCWLTLLYYIYTYTLYNLWTVSNTPIVCNVECGTDKYIYLNIISKIIIIVLVVCMFVYSVVTMNEENKTSLTYKTIWWKQEVEER